MATPSGNEDKKFQSAYAEALAKIESGEDPTGASSPSYMKAADTLNIANGNKTFAESAFETVENIPKFIATSLISGANQLMNIPADIGNLFGGDFERIDTQEVITDLDSNLGAFYEENREGADLVGFIASSLVPGVGGVKLLNAGQKSLQIAISAGRFGTGTSKALGLLVPDKHKFIDLAVKEVATSSSAAGLLNRNALKAMGAGLGQNTLEALAFETAVVATMFNSPILEDMDMGDFISNVAFSAGVVGIIGGALDAVKINSALKGAANTAAIEARPWTFIAEPAAVSNSYEKLVLDFEQLHTMPKVPSTFEPARKTFLEDAAKTKTNRLETRIRGEMGMLADGDQPLAETLYQSFKAADITAKQSAFIGLREVTRATVKGKVAKEFENLHKRVVKGEASVDELTAYADSNISIGYTRAWGEDAGRVTFEAPKITNLVDTLKPGQRIEVDTRKVVAGKETYKFDTRFNQGKISQTGLAKPWDIVKAKSLEVNARYIWANNLPAFKPAPNNIIKVHVDDIPLMEKVALEVKPEDLAYVQFKGLKEGESIGANFNDFLAERKIAVAHKLLEKRKDITQEEIAALINVKNSMLSGELAIDSVNKYAPSDIFAMQDHAAKFNEKLLAQGSRKLKDAPINIWDVPQTMKLTYDSTPFEGVNNFVAENMVIIKEQQKLYQEGTSRAAASVLGNDYNKLQDISSGRVFSGALPTGAGPGLASAASANYGTLASAVENIGRVTAEVIEKFKNKTRDSLDPLLYKLSTNQEATIEWSVLQQRVRATAGNYGLNKAGDALEPLEILKWKAAAEEAVAAGKAAPKQPRLSNPDMEKIIPIVHKETRDLIKAHIELNGERTSKLAGIRTAQGAKFSRDPATFYPIPVNPRDYKHFALVSDDSITSGNHHKTLFANTEEELATMVSKLKRNPHLTVRTKKEAEDYFRSRGEWDYEKTLGDNYLDTELKRRGVSSPIIVSTDPKKVTSDLLDWHMQRETGLVREAVTAKYEVQFEELYRLGEESTNIATSTFSSRSMLKYADDVVKNPYVDYIKTALAIRPNSDYPFWVNVNRMADQALDKVLNKAASIVEKAKTDEELAEVNRLLEKAGYKGAAYDADMEIFANARPISGSLTSIVQKANSILATVVLRLDTLNAVNNAVSANVLLGAETKAIIRAIERGDEKAVGELAGLMKIKVPGTDKLIKAPSKLIANSIKKFNLLDPKSSPDYAFFKEKGYLTSISDQYRNTLNNLTFDPKTGADAWKKRVDSAHDSLRKLADKGEKWTGNSLAEEFNRFVAADVMKQISDVAVKNGLISGKEQLAYINTFVNRTQGNYMAAQRPMMFQGPIGQAIGLFQTYQFNLIQQMLRHVGEGHSKDAMTLLALQGTIHGMNGLPAFNAINTHLVGTASGNKDHKDAYDAVYGTLGKEGGDWLMYGMASNALGLIDPELKINLYTRGDINPKHLTIVPTDPSQVAIVQAAGKVMANLFETAEKLGAGGDVSNILLQGIEHNGISRPLAGLAQVMQGLDNPQAASYSTSKQGNVIATNDLLSLTNLGRLVGGKPLDEAVALDATFRFKAYGLGDAKKRAVLGEAIKSTMLAGGDPSAEQIENFAQKYAESGGRQEEFNGWMTQLYKTANTSQAKKIQRSLTDPFSQSMQRLMGGADAGIGDFNDLIP